MSADSMTPFTGLSNQPSPAGLHPGLIGLRHVDGFVEAPLVNFDGNLHLQESRVACVAGRTGWYRLSAIEGIGLAGIAEGVVLPRRMR